MEYELHVTYPNGHEDVSYFSERKDAQDAKRNAEMIGGEAFIVET